ncbi:GNAT family N-acetyltransferase [Streptacidiphilus sp. MAP5-3]|uniref:GNAT family N-acetyltransferase n=1 Tax=unclassified Streptacidiphilus TaxID=2643834 RepID=UPI003514C80F
MTYRIDRVQPADWERVRDIRLRMTKDTPMAYIETHETALTLGEDKWRFRAGRSTQPGNTGYAAVVAATGEWVGTMNSYLPVADPGELPPYGVWVDPAHRGRAPGVTDALLDACLAWARDEAGVPEMRLHVHEANPRARCYYERRGFTLTGDTMPYSRDPSFAELEMKLGLRSSG